MIDFMEKNYFKFIFNSFFMTVLLVIIVFAIVEVSIGWHEEVDPVSLITYISLITVSMVIVLGLPAFIVSIDKNGIKAGFPSNKLEWNEIDTIKIIGIPKIKSLNKMIVQNKDGHSLEVKLFVFKNQNFFIKELACYLPWASSLVIDSLPSEVKRQSPQS